jgi:hypothetical protein
MMWTCSLTRRQFAEFLRSKGDQYREGREVSSIEEVPYLGTEQIGLLWPRNPENDLRIPTVLLVDGERTRDFFAWALTYLPELRPLTALSRIMPQATAQVYASHRADQFSGALQSGCLGLILGEALSYSTASGGIRHISPSGCASTYSFAMTSALAHGLPEADIDDFGRRWSSVRTLTKQPIRVPSAEQLGLPWSVLRSVVSGTDLRRPRDDQPMVIADACQELLNHGEIRSTALWDGGVGEPASLWDQRRTQTREERVALFETTARGLTMERNTNAPLVEFRLAYLAAQISPGTLEHYALLMPHLQLYPVILPWYGLIAGLVAWNQGLKLGGGLGMRVLRDAQQCGGWLERPTCDVALIELEILLGADNPQSDLRVGAQSQLSVELAPGANTHVRWPPKSDSTGELFSDRMPGREVRDAVAEINMLFHDLDHARARLSRLLKIPEESRDRSVRRQETKNKKKP